MLHNARQVNSKKCALNLSWHFLFEAGNRHGPGFQDRPVAKMAVDLEG